MSAAGFEVVWEQARSKDTLAHALKLDTVDRHYCLPPILAIETDLEGNVFVAATKDVAIWRSTIGFSRWSMRGGGRSSRSRLAPLLLLLWS
jgi:hypothetical protein